MRRLFPRVPPALLAAVLFAAVVLPLLQDGDPLGAEGFATHHVPLTEAPQAYETFQKKKDGAFKVVFKP